MDKVTVIGFKSSGKTCYLAGMYDTMSYGVKNFSLIEKDSDQDFYLQTLWENISSGEGRNWPVPNDEKRAYSFALCHSFDKVMEFEWLDYPGGALVDPGYGLIDEIKSHLADSSCLLVLINGESFAYEGKPELKKKIQAGTKDEYCAIVKKNLKRNKDLVAVKKLSEIATENKMLPPIALVVTKSDLIEDQWIGCVGDIIHESFENIFGEGGEDNRWVMVTAVTLGEGIEDGEDADPENIEQPIAYAVLSMLCNYIERAKQIKDDQNQALEQNNTPFRRIINKKKLEELRRQKAKIETIIGKLSRDAIRLIDLFPEDKPIYINGAKQNLRNFFTEMVSE